MSSKKILIISIISSLLLILASFFVYFRFFKTKQMSRIRVSETKITTTEDNKTIIEIPYADLPTYEKEKNEYMTLEGKVEQTPSDPNDPNSKKMVVIIKNGEQIVPTNKIYVYPLEYMYLGKNVRLKGNWRRNAVIFGKDYRSFWVEDIELIK